MNRMNHPETFAEARAEAQRELTLANNAFDLAFWQTMNSAGTGPRERGGYSAAEYLETFHPCGERIVARMRRAQERFRGLA